MFSMFRPAPEPAPPPPPPPPAAEPPVAAPHADASGMFSGMFSSPPAPAPAAPEAPPLPPPEPVAPPTPTPVVAASSGGSTFGSMFASAPAPAPALPPAPEPEPEPAPAADSWSIFGAAAPAPEPEPEPAPEPEPEPAPAPPPREPSLLDYGVAVPYALVKTVLKVPLVIGETLVGETKQAASRGTKEVLKETFVEPALMTREMFDELFGSYFVAQPTPADAPVAPAGAAAETGDVNALPADMQGDYILDRVEGDLDGLFAELEIGYVLRCACNALLKGRFALFGKDGGAVLVGVYKSTFGNAEVEFPLDGAKTAQKNDSDGKPVWTVSTKDKSCVYTIEVRGDMKFEHLLFRVSEKEVRRRTKNLSEKVRGRGATVECVLLRA